MQHKPPKETTTNQNAELDIPVTVGASTTYSFKEHGGRSSGKTIRPRVCCEIVSTSNVRIYTQSVTRISAKHELNKDNNKEQRQLREEHTNSLSYVKCSTLETYIQITLYRLNKSNLRLYQCKHVYTCLQ